MISKSRDPILVERGGEPFYKRDFCSNKHTYLMNILSIGVPLHKYCKMEYMSKRNFLGRKFKVFYYFKGVPFGKNAAKSY